MKTSDLQQMQQQYQLIAENNASGKYDELIDEYQNIKYKLDKKGYDFTNAAYEMRQLMTSDEFVFAANTDWMGSKAAEIRAKGGPPLPPTYDEWVEGVVENLRQALMWNPEDEG
jgi:hypothetical protein